MSVIPLFRLLLRQQRPPRPVCARHSRQSHVAIGQKVQIKEKFFLMFKKMDKNWFLSNQEDEENKGTASRLRKNLIVSV